MPGLLMIKRLAISHTHLVVVGSILASGNLEVASLTRVKVP